MRRLVAAAVAVLVTLWAADMARRSDLDAWRTSWTASAPARFARHRRAALIAAETVVATSSERFTP